MTISRPRCHVVSTRNTTAAIASGNQPPWTTFGRLAVKNVRSTIRNAIAPVTASRFGLPHTMWTTTKNSTVSIASVPVTAIP